MILLCRSQKNFFFILGCVLQPDKYKGDSKEEFILEISKCKFDDLRKCAAEIFVDKIDLQFSKF